MNVSIVGIIMFVVVMESGSGSLGGGNEFGNIGYSL